LQALALFLCLAAGGARAWDVEVKGAASGGSDVFVAALGKALGEDWNVHAGDGAADVVVALHEGVLAAARSTGKPVLVLLPDPGVALHGNETAVYWAPTLTGQLQLALQILPGLHRVGVLAGANEPGRFKALQDYAEAHDVAVTVRVTSPEFLVRRVADLAAVNDVLIVPVDALFNRDTIKPVLLAAYRQNRGIIGPTPAFVHAGALATLAPTPQGLAAAVAERLRAWARDHRWPPPARISRFEVVTNPQVARALGLHLPDDEALLRALHAEDSTPWP
jgi:ABC-type uncharacterized transport system substrate-binding protein